MTTSKTVLARSRLVALAVPILVGVYAWLAADSAGTATREPALVAAPADQGDSEQASALPPQHPVAPVAAPVTASDGAGTEAQLVADLAADPVARQVPMLFHVSREMQLETLRWLLHVPEDKVAAAIPAVGNRRDLSPGMRRDMARAIIAELITGLERDNVQAPQFSDDLVAARLVGVAPASSAR
jgi:hypothetical protein